MGSDYAAIEALLFSYARAIDTGDLETFGDLFARGTLSIGGSPVSAEGAEAVRALVRRGLHWYPAPEGMTPRTMHLTANVVVHVVEGEMRATSQSYVMVFQALEDFPLQPILGAHYDDELVKEGDTWRFAHRVLTYDLFGDLSRHFTKPVPSLSRP